MEKINIRTQMKTFLTGITPQERHRRSLAACELLAGTKEFRNAHLVMLYMSMPTELETATLAVKAWAEGKSIAAPRVDWNGKKMEPVEITSLDTGIHVVQQGVRSPSRGAWCRWISSI